MRTRSQSRNLNCQQQAPPAVVEPFNLEEPIENPPPPVVTMADNRTMAQLLEAPTEARIWLEKEPPRSIQTWDDLVSKFINKFFPPSKTTNLRNEITRFQQRFDETFYEAWDQFNDLLQACPHHGFSELHQLDTFYNALNFNDQDSLNSAAGGNFLDKMPRDCLRIIESKSKVRNSRNKSVVAKVSSSTSTPEISSDVAELKDMVKALLLDKKNNHPALNHSKSGNVIRDNIQEYVSQAAAANLQTKENTRYEHRLQSNIDLRFSSHLNNHNVQNQETIRIRYNQNRGNFNQASAYTLPFIKVKSIDLKLFKPPALSSSPLSSSSSSNSRCNRRKDFQPT
ncbi:reverse transcriptase domain-containing protein [Tanacetum coccineum]|uniref:Reverse transcriptase domain-containing protein n=1 Tax=Tanacetum coccineum TaxID=301880 RepID=A0ABQ4ZBZ9_9ASTR